MKSLGTARSIYMYEPMISPSVSNGQALVILRLNHFDNSRVGVQKSVQTVLQAKLLGLGKRIGSHSGHALAEANFGEVVDS